MMIYPVISWCLDITRSKWSQWQFPDQACSHAVATYYLLLHITSQRSEIRIASLAIVITSSTRLMVLLSLGVTTSALSAYKWSMVSNLIQGVVQLLALHYCNVMGHCTVGLHTSDHHFTSYQHESSRHHNIDMSFPHHFLPAQAKIHFWINIFSSMSCYTHKINW